ncbi:MAG: sulfatase [Planctomycetota bacterium]
MKLLSHCLRAILATSLIAFAASEANAASRPNILIIVGDDMGYADVGFQGVKEYKTPHLDKLAADGARFTSGYVSGPYCSPTRAGLLTGRYQTRFGHEFNPGPPSAGLPLSETTLADRLRANGYKTALVGKWHLGSEADQHPQKRGFEEFYGFLGGAHSYFVKNGILRGMENVNELDYTTEAFGREAIAFIEKNQKQPWLLYLAFNAVHTPMDARPEDLAKFPHITDPKRKAYAAMMTAMDDAIGKVRQSLEKTGQAESTLIAFISDNGGPTMPGTTTNGSINAPLRGSKRTTLEGGIRVPFLLAWPGQIKPVVIDKPVIQLDLHATALAAAKVEEKPEWKLEGVNLLPFVKGENNDLPHGALFWRFGDQMAVRSGDWKLVKYDSNVETRSGRNNEPATAAKLYNLADDIGETMDLASSNPEQVKKLQALWDDWNTANKPPLWGKNGEAGTAKKAQGKAKSAAKKKQQKQAGQDD